MPAPTARQLIDSLLHGPNAPEAAETLRDHVLREKGDLTEGLEELHRLMDEWEPHSHDIIGFTDDEKAYAKSVQRDLEHLAQAVIGHWMNRSDAKRLLELLYGEDPNWNPNRFVSAVEDLARGGFDVAPAVDALVGDFSPRATKILTRFHTRVDFERHASRLGQALSDAREEVREAAARILAGHFFHQARWVDLGSTAQARDPLIRRGIARGLWDVTIGPWADFTPLVPVLERLSADEVEEVRKIAQEALAYALRFAKRAR